MTTPHLEHLGKFKRILVDYQISNEGKELLDTTKLVFLTSVTAGGRNTIIRELEKTGLYKFFVSDTTRPPRINNGVMEQNGVEYYFILESEFMEGLKRGEYLEAEVIHNQQISGINLKELRRVKEAGKIGINEVGRLGAENIHQASSNPHFIFVVLPSFEEWMRRLENRGKISTEELNRRLGSAERELQEALNSSYFKFVINDKVEDAVGGIRNIVEHDIYPKDLDEKARILAQGMLRGVMERLGKITT